MEEWRGHLVGDESIFTFTRGGADFCDPTAVFRITTHCSVLDWCRPMGVVGSGVEPN